MIKQNRLDGIKIIALNEVNENTFDAWYKSICRWYSREFHTPLLEVESYPEDSVLRTWYEDTFYRLKHGTKENQEQLEEIISSLLQPTDSAIIDQQEEEDEDWYQQELEAIDKQLSKKANKINKSEVTLEGKEEIVNPNLQEDLASILTDFTDEE